MEIVKNGIHILWKCIYRHNDKWLTPLSVYSLYQNYKLSRFRHVVRLCD